MERVKQKKGFTLLEILLVIAINLNRQIEVARNAQRKSDINGTIRRVMYWNTRPTDNILQTMTQ